MTASDPVILYRLLQCETCGARTWTVNDEPPKNPTVHLWSEAHTFKAISNGPGLEPTQIKDQQ